MTNQNDENRRGHVTGGEVQRSGIEGSWYIADSFWYDTYKLTINHPGADGRFVGKALVRVFGLDCVWDLEGILYGSDQTLISFKIKWAGAGSANRFFTGQWREDPGGWAGTWTGENASDQGTWHAW